MPAAFHPPPALRLPHALVAGAVLVATGCGDRPTAPDGTPTVPTVVQEFTGGQQQATVGTTLADPLVVEVLNKKGQPVGGVTVSFAVGAGGGTVSPAAATTNSNGLARTTFTLGATAGVQTVTATVATLPAVTFQAVAAAGAAAQIVVASGGAQTGAAGTALAAPVVLRVVDALGNGVAGVTVAPTPAAGSGTLTIAQPATNAAGEVSGAWQLGTAAGPQRVMVAVPANTAIPAVAVAATAVAGPPASVAHLAGNDQTGESGDQLATPLAVRVVDAHGNPVAGYDVGFAPTSGGGSMSPATAKTDSAGRASAVWTLGAAAGVQRAAATVAAQGASPAFGFQATAVAPSPGSMWALDHGVVDAEYNAAAGTIVTVSAAPARLHVVDPLAKTVQSVDLPQLPLSVSVNPGGTHAAVSHDGYVSYVNLATRTVEKVHPIGTVGGDVVLAGNGRAYVFPRSDQWVAVHTVDMATGVETTDRGYGPYAGALAKLHPSGDFIYSASNNLSPSDFEKYDVRGGTAVRLYDSPYHGDYSFAGNLWITGDGTRIVARSGNVFRSSPLQADDMRYAGALSGVATVQAAVQIAGGSRIYVLGTGGAPPSYYTPDPVAAPDVRAYDPQFLAYKGSARLPSFKVPAAGGGSTRVASEGRFLFENAAGTRLFALVRGAAGSGIAQDWAVAVFDTADLP